MSQFPPTQYIIINILPRWPIGFQAALDAFPSVSNNERGYDLELLTMLANRDSEWIDRGTTTIIGTMSRTSTFRKLTSISDPVMQKAKGTPVILMALMNATKLQPFGGDAVFNAWEEWQDEEVS